MKERDRGKKIALPGGRGESWMRGGDWLFHEEMKRDWQLGRAFSPPDTAFRMEKIPLTVSVDEN